MITAIELTNFKCFQASRFNLASLNVFAGMNGAGKSTVIQSLLTLRQSWESNGISRNRLLLNGSLCELGTAGELYCAEPVSDTISISLESTALSSKAIFSTQYTENKSKEYSLAIAHPGIPNLEDLELFGNLFNYLHAERIGPRKTFPISTNDLHPLCVGKSGENAPFILASNLRHTEIDNKHLLAESEAGKVYTTLQYQWPLWMSRLFPGFDGLSEIYYEADQVRLSLGLQQKQTGQNLYVRPTNTGFGVSFVLGILVAGLISQPNSVLIVENPEAHLHPKAQSCIGEFLARVSASGCQVFVETHSEHVLNGIRRMVKKGTVSNTSVKLHYFSGHRGDPGSGVVDIDISPTGDIAHWPLGFFDQLDSDLGVIFG